MQKGGVEASESRPKRDVVQVSEPPTFGERARSAAGVAARVTRRAVVSEVGAVLASGVVGTTAGTAVITTFALRQGWVLRPEDRDRGRIVVPEQVQQDQISRLTRDREKNGTPDAAINHYQDGSKKNEFILFAFDKRFPVESKRLGFMASLPPY